MKIKNITKYIHILIFTGCTSVGKNSQFNDKKLPPSLKNAEVKTLWIPDKIESDRFEEGHYLYIIEKPATWRSK